MKDGENMLHKILFIILGLVLVVNACLAFYAAITLKVKKDKERIVCETSLVRAKVGRKQRIAAGAKMPK